MITGSAATIGPIWYLKNKIHSNCQSHDRLGWLSEKAALIFQEQCNVANARIACFIMFWHAVAFGFH